MKQIIKRIFERIVFVAIFCGITAIGVGIAWYVRSLSEPGSYAQKILVYDGSIKKALFTPDDDVKDVLLGLIAQEKKSIKIASYSLTDSDIARALIDAHERGIEVIAVVDRSNSEGSYSKVPLLRQSGIITFLYPTIAIAAKEHIRSIMHNKFIVFEDTIRNASLLWTGSFNFTKSASTINQENVVVLDDPSLIDEYKKHFAVLESRCEQVSGPSLSVPVQTQRQRQQLSWTTLRKWIKVLGL